MTLTPILFFAITHIFYVKLLCVLSSIFVNSKKIQNIPIMTSLGCPFGCTFCCVTEMYGRKYRVQSPVKTMEEITHHIKQTGKKGVFFYDDNFCANKKISLELFDLIEKSNQSFQWGCQVRGCRIRGVVLGRSVASGRAGRFRLCRCRIAWAARRSSRSRDAAPHRRSGLPRSPSGGCGRARQTVAPDSSAGLWSRGRHQ